jgi:hypothetical protein
MQKPVCVYIDNSNIFIGGQETAKSYGEDGKKFRLYFQNFLLLITNGTLHFDELVWAGSGQEELKDIFKKVVDQGADLQIIPQAEKGEHETVDQAIQLSMYRHARKFRNNPGVIILCTGDGKGYSEEKGFLYDVKGFIEDGWELVLFSWDHTCHKQLKRFAKQNGAYIPLEKYYSFITFIQGKRNVRPLQKRTDLHQNEVREEPKRQKAVTKRKRQNTRVNRETPLKNRLTRRRRVSRPANPVASSSSLKKTKGVRNEGK